MTSDIRNVVVKCVRKCVKCNGPHRQSVAIIVSIAAFNIESSGIMNEHDGSIRYDLEGT